MPRECSGSEGKGFGNLAGREGCGLRGRIIRKCIKLQIGEVIQPSPTEWQPGGTVTQSHTPHVHPFDSHKRLLAILNDRPYLSLEPPDDTPTFNARECNRCFLSTLLVLPYYDDRKATEKRNILWHDMRHDPHHESEDWEDFKQSKRNSESQHYRTSHDELAKTIFNNTASAGPSGLTTTVPNHSFPSLQPRHHRHSLQFYSVPRNDKGAGPTFNSFQRPCTARGTTRPSIVAPVAMK